MKYILLFSLIQLLNMPLMVLGWFLCLLRPIPWLWNNTDDTSKLSEMTYWEAYVYTALRNPVANLRHVPGVSAKGRPLWYWSNGKYYAKAGWLSDGYICLSAGSGKGY
jgi:hypothetical protein